MPPTAPALWLAWVVALALELGLAAGLPLPPTRDQLSLELGLGLVLGALHGGLARGLLASPAWPGGLMLGVAAVRHLDLLPGLGLGLGLALGLLGAARLPRGGVVVGVLASVLGVLGARAVAVSERAPALWPQRLSAELWRALHPLSSGAQHPGLVVITVDTLRWDAAPRMQSWQRLARRGLVWERAMSTASWTAPAMASAWTGMAPADHGCGAAPAGRTDPIRAEVPVLAEQLWAGGTRTAAFVSNPYVGGDLGFDRGFAKWHHLDEDTPAELLFAGSAPPLPRTSSADERVVSEAREWLRSAPDEGFLLWIHLVGAHLPYRHTDLPLAIAVDSPGDIRDGRLDDSRARRRAVRRAYRGEVAVMDQLIGGLLDDLEVRGFAGSIVFTADHGEEFWEHGGFEHGHSHHGEVVDVPLVVVAPGVPPAARTDLASLVDIASTLRGIAGLPVSGVDLRQPIPDDRIATAAGNLYLPHASSARQGSERVIVTQDVSLYDLSRDPAEQQPTLVREGSALISAALGARPARSDGGGLHLDPDALRALGYID